ncbi:ferric reductase like transmembrane component-domain-containing protein [Lipomyces tetrasporus]|uniref:ferric-chelate reductase (NADPH) n=1 Tax=Lipomyces tetrasporus TaxID=54092 RepID=A0AAD7QVH6_9ASCO|nr:ferric reductase like transmembrane component-domain-containing protein [Lipomyces tetrasporus]KAJ8100517.1 ferric reductase like transmembrane component-domain-containing protein [Lipomyces tetrasporus]
MKIPALPLLVGLIASVEARTIVSACEKICTTYLSAFKTDPPCGVSYYECMCTNVIYPESYAMCIDLCKESEHATAWKSFSQSCQTAGEPLDGTYELYLRNGYADYVDQTDVTQAVATKAVKPTRQLTLNNLAARGEKNHNILWAEYYGNIINAYWAFLIVISFGRHVALKTYPRSGVKAFSWLNTFRKYVTLPAAFGGKHITSIKWRNVGIASVPIRWQFVAVFVLFSLDVIFLFVDMWVTDTPNTVYYTNDIMTARNIGDRAAILTLSQLPVLFLFGGRNNILMFYTGWSFDTFNVFHKWLGRIILMNMSIHGWTFTHVYRNIGNYTGAGAYNYWKTTILDVRENYLGIVALVMLGMIFITSVYVVRRHWYEFFLLLHISLVAVFFGIAWHHVHEHGYMEYFYTALAIWCFDRFIRLCRIIAANPLNNAQVTVNGEATYVTIKPAHGWSAKPGQYAFIYVLRHNFWESHPFSIVETCNGHYVFVAKAHSGLTRKLHKSVSGKNSKSGNVRVWIEGPYGDSFPIARYETVLLIAGGIGITAIMSYALDLKRRETDQHAILYWMSGLIEINVFVTGESGPDKASYSEVSSTQSASKFSEKLHYSDEPKYEIKYNQRPDLSSVIASTVKCAEGSVAVVTCGPGNLMDACRTATAENVGAGQGRVDYFEDAFSWA